MTQKKLARFSASVKVIIITNIPLRAKTFEEAINEAKALKERDVVSFETDFNAGSIEVTAVQDDSVEWP